MWFLSTSFCLNNFAVFLWLQTLLEDIKGDTHGSFEALLVALITPPALFDCHEVMRAMKVVVWIEMLPLLTLSFRMTTGTHCGGRPMCCCRDLGQTMTF